MEPLQRKGVLHRTVVRNLEWEDILEVTGNEKINIMATMQNRRASK